MSQVLATTCQKRGFIWWDGFVIMTSNINVDTRPILQLFAIALCVVSQPNTQQKNYKNGSVCKFTLEVISWKLIYMKIIPVLFLWKVNNVAIRFVNEGTLFKTFHNRVAYLLGVFEARFFRDTC